VKLKTKIGLQLLGGMIGVLIISQAIPLIQARRSNNRLAASSQQLLNDRELQSVKNFQTVVDFSVTAFLGHGDMDVFPRLAALQSSLPGLVEFSLYNLTGTITDSSNKSARGRTLTLLC